MWEIRYATFLIARREALEIAASLLADARKQKVSDSVLVEMEIRLAARTNSIASQLAKYQDPLPLEPLRNAANTLREEGDAVSSRRVLEFVYTSQMKAGNLDQATFLGLAEVKLENNDLAAAMPILRRMVLISGEPFTGLDTAAALLERTHHTAEASEFLTTLLKAERNQDAAGTEAQGAAPKSSNPGTHCPPTAPRRATHDHRCRSARHHSARLADPRGAGGEPSSLALAAARQSCLNISVKTEFTEWVPRNSPDSDNAGGLLARPLGDAQRRLGDLRAALLYQRIAQSIAPSMQIQTINTLRAQLDVAAKNETRRPMVGDGPIRIGGSRKGVSQ